MSLIDKLKKARETGVEIDNFRFTIRRPTAKEIPEIQRLGKEDLQKTMCEIAEKYVVNWSGVKEVDLVPGGGGHEVPFDSELWREWCSDKPEFWMPIADEVINTYQKHRDRQEESKKKPSNG